VTNEEVYALLKDIFDGVTGLAERMLRIEEEVIHRRRIDEIRQRFAGKHFDTAKVVEALEPLRDRDQAVDRRYVTKTFSDFRKGKPRTTGGGTLTKLVTAMGLEVWDVEEDLVAAEVKGR
jgi:hypothetical protein